MFAASSEVPWEERGVAMPSEKPSVTATTRESRVTSPPGNVSYQVRPPRGSVQVVKPHPPTKRERSE